ncbi:LPS-assembly protein LptD [Sphaerotilus sp.]|uniref:LPS-assembly protein LptD n=1 Tax=Sphaerotilus sp. TaxID=2093942 RepID=UPI0034E1948F
MPNTPVLADTRSPTARRGLRRTARRVLALVTALTPLVAAAQSCRISAPEWATQGLSLPLIDATADDDRVHLEADHLSGQTGETLIADGRARLQRGLLSLQAEHMAYHQREDRVQATGQVLLARGDDRYQGSELSLNTEHQDGYFLEPRFYLGRTQAGGRAERVDFIGKNRLVVRGAAYSSCELVDGETPPWVLTTRRVRLDFDANEGVAEGAVLRFYGVPILAAPVLSFPVTDARKSGWLPPLITTSSNTGFGLSVPYYWNIAPDLDATLTPTVLSKRGAGLESEFRYLRPDWHGELNGFWLPRDLTAGRDRWAARWAQQGDLPDDVRYDWHLLRVSDDNYWKDGLRGAESLTPRLLTNTAQAQQRRLLQVDGLGEVEQHLYARLQQWQVLQDTDPNTQIAPPYQRTPQLGALWSNRGGLLQWSLQTEFNRFTNVDPTRIAGSRLHALGQVALPLGDEGWRLTPRASFNAAGYEVDRPLSDGSTRAGRVIPSFSVDSAWSLDRETRAFGRDLTQTLEPRLLYAYTPWRDQSALPNFDSAALDFNATTVFSENVFSGIDRVSDAHQITGGLTTRYLDRRSGAELARLGIAQRYRLNDQRITADGVPATSRFSDVLVQGSVMAIPHWTLDSSLQFNTDSDRVERTITSVRYSPGPLRTLYASHRLNRGVSEQLALGWQWPLDGLLAPVNSLIAHDATSGPARPARSPSSCDGRLYGVGALDYSLKDRRISGAIVGFEYDAGCWVGRVVARRQSTSLQASSTQLMLQLELVGLSRLNAGSNPLAVLKDNIPGYQLLRDPQAAAAPAAHPPATGGDTDTP